MPEIKKIITIDNDIVLSRKKTFFHDAEYKKKRKSRRVSIYRPDGTLLKTEEIGHTEPYSYNYRIIKEYDEKENLIKKLYYKDESKDSPESTTISVYNSDRIVEHTLILDETKYVYHYQFREWEDDGWKNNEWIVTSDKFQWSFGGWKFVKTSNEYKEINILNPDSTYGSREYYNYENGSWVLEKSKSYSFYNNIEGHLLKKVYMDGYIYFFEDYNLHGDYETHRIQQPNGTQRIFTYRYKYDFYGKVISKESFKDGIKQWEILREIEYW